MTLTNWARNITFSTDRLHIPTTVEQLQVLVAGSTRIRALGTGHSFNRIADTTGALVSARGLPAKITVTRTGDDTTVSVPAGANYGEVAVALQAQGLGLPNMGSLPHISVAGACATGTHGSGDGNQCLAAGAVAVEFVRGDGELIRTTAADPEFRGSVLALGALGVVTRLELATLPTFAVRQDVWLDVPVERVVENFDEIMGSAYSISMFDDPNTGTQIDRLWIKSLVEPDGTSSAPDGARWGGRAATTQQHCLTDHDASASTAQLGVPGPWHERLPHFRLDFQPSSGAEQQSEYLVPREHGATALLAIQSLDLREVLLGAEIRSIAADDLWLSPCRGRSSIGVHFTWRDQDAAVLRAVAAVEEALAPFDARPHWGKVFRSDPVAHVERLADFRALVDRHDPERKFGNDFLARHLGI